MRYVLSQGCLADQDLMLAAHVVIDAAICFRDRLLQEGEDLLACASILARR